jgi:hypothetical protein
MYGELSHSNIYLKPVTALDVATFIARKDAIKNIDITSVESLHELRAYAIWKKSIINGLLENRYCSLMSGKAYSYFIRMLNQEQSLACLEGKGKVFEYIFKNGERKLISLWDDQFIVQPDTYWLRHYPFIRQYRTNSHEALLDEQQIRYFPLAPNATNLFLSHNDHFGHFIADNFPAIALLSICPISHRFSSGKCIPLPAGYKGSINSSFALLKTTPLGDISMPEGHSPASINGFETESSLLEIIPSSLAASVFIWSQIKDRILGLANPKDDNAYPEKVFLARGGIFKSRIHNYEYVSKSLESNGFEVIDPCELSLVELIQLLSRASYIVAESGSTTINAALFSRNSTRIVTLCSERLLTNPSEGMIRSGLPYILCFADRIRVVTGTLAKAMPIESSDICEFCVHDILQELVEWRSITD